MSNENLESKRWIIAGAAIVMQLCLGTVYAWSVFKLPLMKAHGWGETSVQATMMINMAVIGLAAAFGGTLVDKKGPRFVATIGGILFGSGVLLAGFADQVGNLFLLWLGFGVIGGLGNGFGYVTPIATLIRWFPDKRGLITGLAVMGFGAKGWTPAGWTPPATSVSAADSFTFDEAIKTPQWFMLWGMLFLNVSAGLGLISQLSPLAQNVVKAGSPGISAADLAIAGGTILAIASIFNGLGRLFWASLSDKIGRKMVFMTMFASQAALYIFLPQISNQLMFTIAACYLLACYGGGFATMPPFAADSFGPGYIGKVYGIMLTAWGCAGVVGPLVFAQIPGQALYV
ncbi:MAG: OFA family MFS transporter, partial [Syntrophales bacterium]|nr:OFA family MFS transporter [Syntrophales bacterium]